MSVRVAGRNSVNLAKTVISLIKLAHKVGVTLTRRTHNRKVTYQYDAHLRLSFFLYAYVYKICTSYPVCCVSFL